MINRIYLNLSLLFTLIVAIVFFPNTIAADAPKQKLKDLKPYKVTEAPVIDGVLDDEVWKQEPNVDDVWITYNPVYGDMLPQKTRVWVAYDEDNLYFAFHCYDDEPDKIKTTLSQRDSIFSDDWVGFSLDAVGNKQNAYDLFVNPNGIQADIHRTQYNQDSTTDWVWYSSGKIVDDGYTVEIHIPLKNIKFTSGEDVEMFILFWRKVSRSGYSASWPEIPPGQGVFNCQAKMHFDKLNSQNKLEVLPSFTYGSIWDRESPDNWSSPDTRPDIGIGIKYGITSKITAELTINPDFSQVESDTFQVAVNQRYPLFYSEKRPFFMEADSLFALAGTSGDSNLWTAVHTRKIVDPLWGMKLSGEVEETSFGILVAGDEWPGRSYGDGEENPNKGDTADFILGRFKVGLGGENYIGAIYSGREFSDEYNRVFGGDLNIRFLGNHSIRGFYLETFSNDLGKEEPYSGRAFGGVYAFDTRPIYIKIGAEHFDEGFRMDTAYYLRTGITKFYTYIAGPNIYPDSETFSWVKRISPILFGYWIYDSTTDMTDYSLLARLYQDFTNQGWLMLQVAKQKEYWNGIAFEKMGYSLYAGAQFTNWLNVGFTIGYSDKIYYPESFLGKGISSDFWITLQPINELKQYFEVYWNYLDRVDDDSRVYDDLILISQTTYQFNKYLFIRAMIQYDSYPDTIMTDFLASFTLIPGTVIHLGYGSLYENREWSGSECLTGTELGKLYQTSQSIFFKVSYLFQF